MAKSSAAEYRVRYFVDDDKTEDIPFPSAASALHNAICWEHMGEYESGETPDYVEVIRKEGNIAYSLLWLNDGAQGGIEIDEEDPDYAEAERAAKEYGLFI